MKVNIKLIYLAFVLSLMISCEDSIYENDAELFTVEVQVNYPTHYNVDKAGDVNVRLINLENGLSVTKQSSDDGKVYFDNVKKGGYRLSFGKKIPSLEASGYGENIIDQEDINDGRLVNLNVTMEDLFLFEDVDLGKVNLKSSLPGDYLIKEVYYTGSTTPNDRAYYADHFVEIYNNTNKVLFADSLCIATVYGANGATESSPTEFSVDPDHVYLTYAWMVPGTGKQHPIMPGESIVIAQDGINHRDDSNGNPNSIDLSDASWETFLLRDVQRDIDVVEVPNMIEIFANRPNTHDWILHSYGPAIVLFKSNELDNLDVIPEPNNTQGYTIMRINSSDVLDGFESLAYANSGGYKRLPESIDAGFTYCNGIFNLESCRRKVEDNINGRIILQDTNNSSEDFEVVSFPTPYRFE
ncbi:MAG: DUF4876 domain-containing protein [Bacteroidetes bacterium]|nr:DUF4876 domain-containing protein [Bacteroidota bacterium]